MLSDIKINAIHFDYLRFVIVYINIHFHSIHKRMLFRRSSAQWRRSLWSSTTTVAVNYGRVGSEQSSSVPMCKYIMKV